MRVRTRWVVAVLLSTGSARAQGTAASEAGHKAPVDPPKVRIERPAPEGEERLRKTLGQEAARRRVEDGRVHPRLRDIERAATRVFNPNWSLAADHPRELGSVGNTMKEMGRSVLRSWVALAPHYAMNRPMPERPRHPSLERPGDEDDPTLLETYDEHVHRMVESANALSAVVCLRLSPAAETAADVVRTSGRGRFDRMARESALVAAEARPYPAGAAAVRACYRFTAQFATVPPLPFFSCTLEKPERRNSRCVYPFKRVIAKDVELISVE